MTDVAILGELAYWQQTGIRVGAGLAAVLLVAGAGHEATACAGMTGTVEGMPVGADAVAPQPKQALERSCCTPPRRQSLLHRAPEESPSMDDSDDDSEYGTAPLQHPSTSLSEHLL